MEQYAQILVPSVFGGIRLIRLVQPALLDVLCVLIVILLNAQNVTLPSIYSHLEVVAKIIPAL